MGLAIQKSIKKRVAKIHACLYTGSCVARTTPAVITHLFLKGQLSKINTILKLILHISYENIEAVAS